MVRKATRLTLKELQRQGGDPNSLDSDIHCLRGLDQLVFNNDRNTVKQKQRNFVLGVLQQQHSHQQMGISDPTGLGVFARACSKRSRERAVAQAAADARDACIATTPGDACKTDLDEKEFCSSILRDALDLVNQDGDVEFHPSSTKLA